MSVPLLSREPEHPKTLAGGRSSWNAAIVKAEDELRETDRRKEWQVFALGLVAGALLLGLGSHYFGPALSPPVNVLEGRTNGVNYDGSAIGFDGSGLAGEGFVVAGAQWRQDGGPWEATMPTCLQPSSSGQRVTLGVVQVPPVDDAPGRSVVVWLVCHGGPTAHF